MWPVLLASKLHQHKDLHIASLQYKNDHLIYFLNSLKQIGYMFITCRYVYVSKASKRAHSLCMMTNAEIRIRLKNPKENKKNKMHTDMHCKEKLGNAEIRI